MKAIMWKFHIPDNQIFDMVKVIIISYYELLPLCRVITITYLNKPYLQGWVRLPSMDLVRIIDKNKGRYSAQKNSKYYSKYLTLFYDTFLSVTTRCDTNIQRYGLYRQSQPFSYKLKFQLIIRSPYLSLLLKFRKSN